jgi:hypothetical protein
MGHGSMPHATAVTHGGCWATPCCRPSVALRGHGGCWATPCRRPSVALRTPRRHTAVSAETIVGHGGCQKCEIFTP